MKPIITVNNISKKYDINAYQGKYVALRDVLTNIMKSPFSFLKSKVEESVGKSKKEEYWALKDINFTVNKGEVIGIIGHNGAGKSTILKILSQITPPTTGEIIINGRIASLLEVGTGFHPELTGRENIFLNGAILGMSKDEIEEKFDEIVDFAGIGKFIDMPVKKYSSGMHVRLAFSVAAHMEPDILLVDEVLAVGDAEFQKKCLGKMDEVTKQSGRTIVFVSHDMGAVQKLCQKCILLEEGKIKTMGETKNVVSAYLKEEDIKIKTLLADRKDRIGNGYIKINDVKIFDEKNNSQINSVISGQDIYLEINYKAKEKNKKNIDNITFSLVFVNKFGQFITALNSKMANNEFKLLPLNGKIYCHIPNFPLMPGSFNVKTSVRVNEILADQIENAFTIKVEEGDFFKLGIKNEYKRQGIYINHNWTKK